MHESFLHFIYKYRLWTNAELHTTTGKPLEIIDTGVQNFDSGPDFFNAKIAIDGMVWVGNVEIHINASDWLKHKHDRDFAYNNVVLHVVYNADKSIKYLLGGEIPVWEIEFSHALFNKYSEWELDSRAVPCSEYIDLVDRFKIDLWIERLAVERLEEKSQRIAALAQRFNGNMEEVFYVILARSFGFGTNAEAFQLLAASTPLNVVLKNVDNLAAIEAVLFGQAGLMPENGIDEYTIRLQTDYDFYRRKYDLTPLPRGIWKTARMRPGNFPDMRIAQFAALMCNFQNIFAHTVNCDDINTLKQQFDIQVSDYWKRHYSFGHLTQKTKSSLGEASLNVLIINALAPFVFHYYSCYSSDAARRDLVVDRLLAIPAEDNRDTRLWADYGITCNNAMQSQALIHLKKNYCDKKRCLNCSIGYEIFYMMNQIDKEK